MKHLIALVILAIAASAEQCSEKRAEDCVGSLLTKLLGETSEEEVCNELRSSVSCLRTAVDECTSGEKDEEVEEGLAELAKVLKENCEEGGDQVIEEDDAVAKCFAENEDYVYECIEEATSEVLAILLETDQQMDDDNIACSMYALTATCFVEKINEKCGEEASKLAEAELKDMPQNIAEACENSEGFIAHTFELLNDDGNNVRK